MVQEKVKVYITKKWVVQEKVKVVCFTDPRPFSPHQEMGSRQRALAIANPRSTQKDYPQVCICEYVNIGAGSM